MRSITLNDRSLKHERTRALYKGLVMAVSMYGSEVMLQNIKEMFRISVVQIDNTEFFG